jgi:hypothetical protein
MDRGGDVRDRIYGSRNRNWLGIFGGKIDKRVANAVMEWYGKKVISRMDVFST